MILKATYFCVDDRWTANALSPSYHDFMIHGSAGHRVVSGSHPVDDRQEGVRPEAAVPPDRHPEDEPGRPHPPLLLEAGPAQLEPPPLVPAPAHE